MNKRYSNLIIDTFCQAHKTFNSNKEFPIQISQKPVYRESSCNFINSVEDLVKNYLESINGNIYLLFDNFYSTNKITKENIFKFAGHTGLNNEFVSRRDLNPEYKTNRSKQTKSFYNTISLLKYYYLIGPSYYHTIMIPNLEADDLVKPLLHSRCENQNSLLVTTDLDWCRYLSDKVDILSDLSKGPRTVLDISHDLGFRLTENNLILYKAIFGDSSDNISGIISENSKHKEEFIYITQKANFPEEALLLSRDVEELEKSEVLKAIHSNEKKFMVNVQLVSNIECTPQHIDSVITSGRNSEITYKALRLAIGLDQEKQEFTFGNIKRPRS